MKTAICVIAAALILAVPAVFADVQPAQQESLHINITKSGMVAVSHLIADSDVPVRLLLVPGTVNGLEVTDPDGNPAQHNKTGTHLVLPPSDEYSLVRYELADALVLRDNVWQWNYRYLEKTTFFFSNTLDMIYVSGMPVILDDKHAVNCHGCQMLLEFFFPVTQTAHISWGSENFPVSFASSVRIDSVTFDQPQKRMSFAVDRPDALTTVIMPLALLWEPYDIYLDDKPVNYHNISNQTHVWLSFKSDGPGIITIIGTTAVPEFTLLLPLLLATAFVLAISFPRIIPR